MSVATTKMEDLVLESDGLTEAIVALEAYRDEVYMDKDENSDSFGVYDGGMGIKMTIDKLKDKLALVKGQMDWYMRIAESSKPSTTPR